MADRPEDPAKPVESLAEKKLALANAVDQIDDCTYDDQHHSARELERARVDGRGHQHEHSAETHETRRRIAPAKCAKSQPRWKLRQLSMQRRLQRCQMSVDRGE